MKDRVNFWWSMCSMVGYTLYARIPIVLLVLIFIPLMSCVPVIKLVYGLHQPRYVSDNNVIRYAEKIDWEGAIYRLKDYSEEERSKYRYLGNRLPDILVFNSAGLITKLEIDCSSDIDNIAKLSIEAIDSLEAGDKSIHDFNEDTYLINSLEAEYITSTTPIYVVKFAEFVGKLNKDSVPGQLAILGKRNDVKYVLLNMDYTIVD